METIKSYTDIERSKVLAEILPLDSADMSYPIIHNVGQEPYHCNIPMFVPAMNGDIPCWSLAALLNVLPKIYYPVKDHKTDLILGKPKDKWCILYWDTTGMQHGEETLGDNPVDACYEMILRFKEKNLI